MSIQTHLEALHGAWCHATGQDLHFKSTERIFYELHQMAFTPADVQTVVAHLLRFNKNSSSAKFSLRASRVLGDLEVFASALAEAKAVNRNKRQQPTPKDKVIALHQQIQEPEQSSTMQDNSPPKSFGEILKKAINL